MPVSALKIAHGHGREPLLVADLEGRGEDPLQVAHHGGFLLDADRPGVAREDLAAQLGLGKIDHLFKFAVGHGHDPSDPSDRTDLIKSAAVPSIHQRTCRPS